MTLGMACPPGTGVYSWQIRFDAVLTPQEQVALTEKLKEDTSWVYFTGTEGGRYTGEETQGRYCEVTGVADAERGIIYPKIVRYVYEDSAKTLMISTSDFFEGKELTTLRFDAVRISSALFSRTASPEAMLRAWEEAEEKIDGMWEGFSPQVIAAPSVGDRQYERLGDDIILASAYACDPLPLTVRELWPTALLTLLAAVAMAAKVQGREVPDFPKETAIGALGQYVSDESIENFQPMNINFSIIAPLEKRIRKKAEKNLAIAARSLDVIDRLVAKGI